MNNYNVHFAKLKALYLSTDKDGYIKLCRFIHLKLIIKVHCLYSTILNIHKYFIINILNKSFQNSRIIF